MTWSSKVYIIQLLGTQWSCLCGIIFTSAWFHLTAEAGVQDVRRTVSSLACDISRSDFL